MRKTLFPVVQKFIIKNHEEAAEESEQYTGITYVSRDELEAAADTDDRLFSSDESD